MWGIQKGGIFSFGLKASKSPIKAPINSFQNILQHLEGSSLRPNHKQNLGVTGINPKI
jgi:hypothetical protein